MALYKAKGTRGLTGGHWVTIKDGRWKGQHVYIKDNQTFDEAIEERKKHAKGLDNMENRPVANKLAKQKQNKIDKEESYEELVERTRKLNEKNKGYKTVDLEEKDNKDRQLEKDAKDVIKTLNDEGSDFTFGEVEIKDGKIKTTVGVFMPDERGYTEKDLEIPISKEDNFDSIKEKLDDWESKHSSPDTFYDNDFENEEKSDNGKDQSKQDIKYKEDPFVTALKDSGTYNQFYNKAKDLGIMYDYQRVDNMNTSYTTMENMEDSNISFNEAKEFFLKKYAEQDNKSKDVMSIKELNDTMLGDKYKGKGETPSLVYSNDRRIDISNNADGGKTATIWKDGKIERKTRLPENVTGDKTKQYFDDNLAKLDQNKYDKETDGMSDYQKFAYATSKMAINKNYMSSEEKEHWQGVIDTYNNNSSKRASEYFEKQEASALKNKDMSYSYSDKGLKSLSNKELDDYVKKQQELISQYDKEYNQNKTYDQRYKRNKQDTMFSSAMKTKYETQLQRANEEKARRQEEVNKYFKTQTPEEAKQEEDRINKKLYGINNEPKPFVQQVDIDGGEYTYEPERIKRMEQAGMKPSTHSYTGGGWQGTKYDGALSTKDIAKNINEYSKKEFPGVKLNRKTGVNNLDFYVMSTPQDIYKSVKDIDRMSDKDINDTLYKTTGGVSKLDDWLNKNNRKTAKGTYTNNDVKDYLKEELNTYKNRTGYAATGNEWYLNDYGKKLISGLNREMNSYNYDDSDGMVDYFDTNFYGYVNIGKWDKPYEVSQPKSKALKMSELVQTYVDRGYSEETARKMAKQAINKRKRK